MKADVTWGVTVKKTYKLQHVLWECRFSKEIWDWLSETFNCKKGFNNFKEAMKMNKKQSSIIRPMWHAAVVAGMQERCVSKIVETLPWNSKVLMMTPSFSTSSIRPYYGMEYLDIAIVFYGSQCSLILIGWPKFVKGNNLEEGDIYEFELIEDALLKVHIVSKYEDVSPTTKNMKVLPIHEQHLRANASVPPKEKDIAMEASRALKLKHPSFEVAMKFQYVKHGNGDEPPGVIEPHGNVGNGDEPTGIVGNEVEGNGNVGMVKPGIVRNVGNVGTVGAKRRRAARLTSMLEQDSVTMKTTMNQLRGAMAWWNSKIRLTVGDVGGM
ncbi:hypothetical protein IFM89_015686 [Coptis chinensis]|uniref:TF-B3 domain-containing protein n=1 Tax=Coptis chinensis TaxID=261450 RepID=A0A835ICS0_9MAGN|nr:hypothetical protein IFM89_015686 [Coptis chinensis]